MTIFITISKGLVARNLLQNNFFNLIKKKFDKVVILSFAASDKRFKDEFLADNVEIIPLVPSPGNFINNLISNVNKFLIYNDSTNVRSRYGFFPGQKELNPAARYLKYIILKMIFQPLAKLNFFRKSGQYFDYLFLQQSQVKKYESIIENYQPDVIFVASILEEAEVALLKAAKRKKVKTIAMTKSWDNLSKRYFRARADKLAVWSSFMKKQAQLLQDYKKENIEIIGVPQFDYYTDKSRLETRKDFCKRLNLDPGKKIIFYGSEGKASPDDGEVVEIIAEMIKKKELAAECQILVRPHFAYTNDHLKFERFFKGSREVVVDLTFKMSEGFSDQWDYSNKQMNHFLNSLYHCDMLLNPASTLTIDAIAVNKPVILIYFDGYKEKKFGQSVARFYDEDYLKEIVEFQAAINAKNKDDLKQGINSYLISPALHDKEREELRKYFCDKIDGRAGERLYKTILSHAGLPLD